MKKILILLSLILLLSCGGKKVDKTKFSLSDDDLKFLTEGADDISEQKEYENITIEEINAIINKLANSDIKVQNKKIKESKYTISSSYLNETLAFNMLDTDKWNNMEIGVIGTSNVKMYTDMSAKTIVTAIPKGAVIPLLNEHSTPPEGDFFKFNEEYNNWYETEYQGKKGFVFGSYIVRKGDSLDNILTTGFDLSRKNLDSENERLIRLSYYYTKNVKSDKFFNFNGGVLIPENMQQALIKDKIALEQIDYNDYINNLNIDNPDDMIVLYKMLHNDKTAATFITIDFLNHNLHLLFDRMLQETEQRSLYPILKILTKKYYDKLSEYETKLKPGEKVLKESVELSKKYFLVAGHILGLNLIPENKYPQDVKEELDLINKAEGFVEEAPIFKYKEDYSQFKPRGHYTKSNILKKYFKAMMWFGRLHFYCVKDRSQKENDLALKLTPAAILLTKIANEDNEILGLWKAVFMPINYLIGESDDYNLMQYISLNENVDYKNFGAWLEKENNILNFIDTANKKLASPKISGNTLRQNNEASADKEAKAPQGFKFFGQRFTFDSFIHNQLSSPRVGTDAAPRNMVKGIDVMAVMGSKFADQLLASDKKDIERYSVNFTNVQNQFNKFGNDDFASTFYNGYLKIIKETTNPDNKNKFYFTQTEAWDKKSLLTSLGTWAELRHDTILYVKQSYAEKSGKGPEMTWVLDPVARPIGYVEPNLQALYWIQSVLEDSILLLSVNGFMSEKYKQKYGDYKNIIDKLIIIAELQAEDKPITNEQNEFIYSIPYNLSKIVLPNISGDYIEQKELQMALIADVHTDSVGGVVLEVAVGVPYKIYIALNDGNGGKRIAEGYTFSYYEFEQPMNDRLNDDQWKAAVYTNEGVEDKKPEWLDIIYTAYR